MCRRRGPRVCPEQTDWRGRLALFTFMPMGFLRRRIFVRSVLVAATALALGWPAAVRAQTPTLTQSIPAQTLVAGGAALTIDLRNYFAEPTIAGQVVQFDTVLGKFSFTANRDADHTPVVQIVRDGKFAIFAE